jgi:pimeloyl-ACP methyl ester carboxylesterase
VCGADGGPPVVLLPGGRSTSAGWYANVGALAPVHRVYAVDILGDVGRSVPGGEPVASRDDIVAWLDGVLDGLGVDAVALGGHSYGGWIAARYAIARPERVSSLVLVDPAELARLTMPVLVFAARESRQNKAAALAGAARKLPDARVEVIADATHFTVPQDRPDEINPVLADFLS